MDIPNRITKLRSLMEEHQMDAYLIPSADNHQSEYVGEHFMARQFISGFTGSAGTVFITKDEAGLLVDGRYVIQAEKQLQGSGIKLFQVDNAGVQTVAEYLRQVIPNNGTLGFDGRVISMQEGKHLESALLEKRVKLVDSIDLTDSVWEDRPALSDQPVFSLDEKYTGENTKSKLERVRKAMEQEQATAHIITTLDDVAWLVNLRGKDVKYYPLFLCYAIVRMDRMDLFIDERKLSAEIRAKLESDGIHILPYNDIYSAIKELDVDETVLIDPNRINYALYNSIPKQVSTVTKDNPTVLFKAMKNEVEIKNIKNAHVKDGIAVTKFMYWLKNNLGKIKVTEMSASDKLEEFRRQQDGYLWIGFAPICAYKEHAAMAHYSATEESNAELLPGHFFLADTGGNYYEGSNDMTRTFALGTISDELKTDFTTVLRAMINLSKVKFLHGCTGYNLDILARQPLWERSMDYKHGTGHGIGYLLSVHEGPAEFRWQINADKLESNILQNGMVITNEPGIYIQGSHGIRIENEMLVRKGPENEYGQFMYLEPITYAPIDLDAIVPEQLSLEEKQYLNWYHQLVYDTIAPHLTDEEVDWLKSYTREI